MKWVMFAFVFFVGVSLVYANPVGICTCDSCIGLGFTQLGANYNYCIKDSDCTQSFLMDSQLGSLTLTSGQGWYGPGLGAPLYTFSAPNSCSTPGGCTLPVSLVSSSRYGTITIPANSYEEGPVFIGAWWGCPSGGETYGINWNNLNPFGSVTFYPSNCQTDEVCHVMSDRQHRLFYGGVAVKATQQGGATWYEDTMNPSSIIVSDDSGIWGMIEFDIPANTFDAGEIQIGIYDLMNKIPISEQSGGQGTISFSGPPTILQIDVSPETCYTDSSCDVEITVLNIPIDMNNQLFSFSGAWVSGQISLTDPGVSVSGDTIYYTIPAGTLSAGILTVYYSDDDLYQEDSETINVPALVCVPSGCDGICPANCNVAQDGDCGCSDSDSDNCCGIGCTSFNDNDCPVSCGDGNIIIPEVCEPGVDLFFGTPDDDNGLEDCTTVSGGFAGGTLYCAPGCLTFNVSSCVVCDNDNTADPGEDCDGSDLNGEDCTNHGFSDPAGLNCNPDCTFDTSSCGGATSSPTPGPVVGPNEYLINGNCVNDNDGDEYGLKSWVLYDGVGIQIDAGYHECVLDVEEIPMFSFWSVLLFLIILVFFYSRQKRQGL